MNRTRRGNAVAHCKDKQSISFLFTGRTNNFLKIKDRSTTKAALTDWYIYIRSRRSNQASTSLTNGTEQRMSLPYNAKPFKKSTLRSMREFRAFNRICESPVVISNGMERWHPNGRISRVYNNEYWRLKHFNLMKNFPFVSFLNFYM